MTLRHTVDPVRRLITISGRGGMHDAIDSAARLLNDSSLDGDYSLLYMVAESDELTPSQLLELSELLKLVLRRFHGRVAVAAPGVGQQTPAHLVTMFADDGYGRIRIFSGETDALAWVTEPLHS